jgi:hypothetical protein
MGNVNEAGEGGPGKGARFSRVARETPESARLFRGWAGERGS